MLEMKEFVNATYEIWYQKLKSLRMFINLSKIPEIAIKGDGNT